MGGDYAPEAAVKGAVMALDAIGSDSRVVLFGDEEKIKSVLASEGCPAERFGIVATTEVIEMGDHPAKAFQAKADSSITVGFGHLAKGAIDGFASAGSTGAMMVGSMYLYEMYQHISPPYFPSIPNPSDQPYTTYNRPAELYSLSQKERPYLCLSTTRALSVNQMR